MKVYSYFNYVPECADPDLIGLWERSWQRHGWETVVLNENDARLSDPAMFERLSRSPLLETRNPRAYTVAAMMRWIPMTKVSEPALHVDWDVFCNGIKPEDIIIHDPVPTFLAGSTCPCAVAASPRGWKLFAALLEFAPFIPAFSASALAADSCDQYACAIIAEQFGFIQPECPCKLYQEQAGWEKAGMRHYPNRLMPFPRSRSIAALEGL